MEVKYCLVSEGMNDDGDHEGSEIWILNLVQYLFSLRLWASHLHIHIQKKLKKYIIIEVASL